MRVSLPGPGGSLGECVFCGKNFAFEILSGATLRADRDRLDWLEQAVKSNETDLGVFCWANEDIGQESEVALEIHGEVVGQSPCIRTAIDIAMRGPARQGGEGDSDE